jgi:hypothetical protein
MKPPLRHGSADDFQTPDYALGPLLRYLRRDWTVWECACGRGNLAAGLRRRGFTVLATDVAEGHDFLSWQPRRFDCVITNPPFKYKDEFIRRCYLLGKPFALLLPLTTFETPKRQRMFQEYGVEVIFLDRRINFETPRRVVESSSWFATAWFTFGLGIGQQLSFAQLICE